ncbi:MAG TPA: phosphate ABC transporter substrate-binding protein PstS [Gemmataceae bacterium]|nr:phosphate ABC transporter substrate-binding protein PstS [Gemmataceae bacterium]
MIGISKRLPVGLAFLFLLVCGGCGNGSRKVSGSGSTFIKPIMDKWIQQYTKERGGLEINYQGTGSTAGIKQMTDQAVDFACTDAFLTQEQMNLAAKRGQVVHIPLALGAIVPAYNLKDIDKPLNFSGEVLAAIFRGKIKKWNDPALRAINEGVALPDLDISVVHRTEGSGSTFIFTEYLSKVSPEWKEQVGANTSVKWPVGTGEQGNPGVAGFLGNTPGSIGYIELYYALLKAKDIQFGAVKNKAGKFIRADLVSVRKAAENSLANIPDDLRFSLTDAEGVDSYPIAGATWAVLYTNPTDDTGKALVDFLIWAIHEGQKYNESMHYANVPEALVKRIDEKLKK